jgi:thiol:disulfide interchange protein DsbD
MKLLARPVLFAALLLAVVIQAPAAQPGDDPFSEANKAPTAAPPPANKGADLANRLVAERITFTAEVEPREAKPGTTVRLTIRGTPKPGFHTYPLTQRAPDQQPEQLCKLAYELVPGLRLLGPVTESEPEAVDEKAVGILLEHSKPFTWSMDVLILPDATPGEKELPLTVTAQVCDTTCVTGNLPVKVAVRVLEGAAVPLTPELTDRLAAPLYEIKEVSALLLPTKPPQLGNPPTENSGKDRAGGAKGDTPPPAPDAEEITADSTLIQIVALAGGAAFLMLLTPCVFPMIPITVSFFLKQAENKHNNPVLLASVYSLTIVVLLSAAVLLLGGLVIVWANDPWLNLAMGMLLMFFALSLFGMYEIELPHFLSQFTSQREGQGGYVGVFFMSLTFTITSFTCTGPFLGPLLVGAKELQLSPFQLVVAAVAYATTFAAPFFVLALFPGLLKSLPKSGGWLNAVKVVMGFVEVALAMKFFSIMDAMLFPGQPQLFNFDTVLCTWIVLSAACGLYLLGVYRLPHDTPLEHVSVPRLLFATFFLGLALYMTPALWRNKPLGVVGGKIVAFLPLDSRLQFDSRSKPATAGAAKASTGELIWHGDYQKAWELARKENKLLFIDFTGTNCINCRDNEDNVFPLPAVQNEFEQFVLVRLYTDVVPDPSLSRQQAKADADRNLSWQGNTFGDISLPLYAVLDPSGTSQPVTDDGKLTGAKRGKVKGKINDVSGFVQMLTRARESKQVAQRP